MDQFFIKMMGFISSVHASTHAYLKESRSGELTPLQNEMMEYLFMSEEKTLTDIADCLDLSLPNCSREVKKLVELGMLKKTTSHSDRRKTFITLTPKGKKETELVFRHIQEQLVVEMNQISEVDQKNIIDAMNLMEKYFFKVNNEG